MTTARVRWAWMALGPGMAAVLLAGLSGCGGGDPFGVVPVSGKVTYDDGSLIPAERIAVTFVPQAEAKDQKTFPRLGKADVDVKTGEFKAVTTNTYGDGATLGKHRIQIQARNKSGTVSPLVPSVYEDPVASPIGEVEVGPGSAEFHFKVRRP